MPEVKKKIIVTNKGALYGKYSTAESQAQIEYVLERLKCFDAARNIDTKLIYLDDETEMGAKAVKVYASERQNKKAIDDIFERYNPAYLIILGSQDIVPFQTLKNPSYPSESGRVQKFMPSDLPYACIQEKHTGSVDNYLSPCRIVSRIPDVPENALMGLPVLLNSIGNIMNMRTRAPEKYRRLWALCTMKRTMPMSMTLAKMFPPPLDPKYDVCPPSDPERSAEIYKRLTHFHIVHGGSMVNTLTGEDMSNPPAHPTAVLSDHIDGNITLGTIVLERACFGAQLYDPAKARRAPRTLPLAAMYMRAGAAAMLGSCVQNFSSESGMKLGDYLVSEFFTQLNNTSVGEAFLKARLKVVSDNRIVTPGDKTMFGAFVLYGDASIVPVSDALPEEDEVELLPDTAARKTTWYTNMAVKNELEAEYIGEEVTGEIPEDIKKAVLDYVEAAGAKKIGYIKCSTVVKGGVPIPEKLRFTVNAIIGGEECWFIFDTPGEPVTFVEKYSV